MAAPSIPGAEGGGGETRALLLRRRVQLAQHVAAQRVELRRKHLVAGSSAPLLTATSILKRHVLQGDFGNVVSSPTPGYVECEVVLDGDQIRIYAPPA